MKSIHFFQDTGVILKCIKIQVFYFELDIAFIDGFINFETVEIKLKVSRGFFSASVKATHEKWSFQFPCGPLFTAHPGDDKNENTRNNIGWGPAPHAPHI